MSESRCRARRRPGRRSSSAANGVPPISTDAIEVVNPATEQVIGAVPAGGAADIDTAVRRRTRPARGWAATTPARARGRISPRSATGSPPAPTRPRELIATELGAPLTLAQRLHVGLPLTVLDSYIARCSATYRVHRAESATRWSTRAGRRRRRDHAVELPAAPGRREGRGRARRRLHGRAQAGRGHAADRLPAAPRSPSRRPAAGRAQRRLRPRPGRRPGARRAPRRRHGLVHRLDRGRPADRRHRGRRAQARRARTRRQVRERDPARRRPRPRRSRSASATRSSTPARPAARGPGCSCTRSVYDEAVALAADAAAKYTTGDPFDPATRLGPLVADRQRTRVRGYIDVRRSPRARGWSPAAPTPAARRGYFVAPDACSPTSTPDMTIAQEEIFGPVLSILRFRDEDEALAIANGTAYGLAGGVWAADNDTASAFAARMRTGQVDINGGAFNPLGAVRRVQVLRPRPRTRPPRARRVPAVPVAAVLIAGSR